MDYMLRFNFHSESMTTFSQSSWISGTKPIARMKNIKSKVKKEKKVKHDIHRQSFLSIYCLQVQQFAIRQFLTLDPEVSQTSFCSPNFFYESNFFLLVKPFFLVS